MGRSACKRRRSRLRELVRTLRPFKVCEIVRLYDSMTNQPTRMYTLAGDPVPLLRYPLFGLLQLSCEKKNAQKVCGCLSECGPFRGLGDDTAAAVRAQRAKNSGQSLCGHEGLSKHVNCMAH